jgi:hypothetical protein
MQKLRNFFNGKKFNSSCISRTKNKVKNKYTSYWLETSLTLYFRFDSDLSSNKDEKDVGMTPRKYKVRVNFTLAD